MDVDAQESWPSTYLDSSLPQGLYGFIQTGDGDGGEDKDVPRISLAPSEGPASPQPGIPTLVVPQSSPRPLRRRPPPPPLNTNLLVPHAHLSSAHGSPAYGSPAYGSPAYGSPGSMLSTPSFSPWSYGMGSLPPSPYSPTPSSYPVTPNTPYTALSSPASTSWSEHPVAEVATTPFYNNDAADWAESLKQRDTAQELYPTDNMFGLVESTGPPNVWSFGDLDGTSLSDLDLGASMPAPFDDGLGIDLNTATVTAQDALADFSLLDTHAFVVPNVSPSESLQISTSDGTQGFNAASPSLSFTPSFPVHSSRPVDAPFVAPVAQQDDSLPTSSTVHQSAQFAPAILQLSSAPQYPPAPPESASTSALVHSLPTEDFGSEEIDEPPRKRKKRSPAEFPRRNARRRRQDPPKEKARFPCPLYASTGCHATFSKKHDGKRHAENDGHAQDRTQTVLHVCMAPVKEGGILVDGRLVDDDGRPVVGRPLVDGGRVVCGRLVNGAVVPLDGWPTVHGQRISIRVCGYTHPRRDNLCRRHVERVHLRWMKEQVERNIREGKKDLKSGMVMPVVVIR
ncbi:hypothetical protein BD626DRAFT_566100 [Schizophyllum amplum]|uniref:Uncharacterized protein n=1 Tax=Schizophyllum amplum TaxID=97359 RepID=A0A550CQI3_9AGAR|nr:hypothetical protein BD626DRAFT_566100 [Auriculariopsis ampla]